MPRYRRCSVVACKNRRISAEEKVFTFPYVKEVAEEWVKFSNNPDLRIEEAHLYAKRGRVMCHRHFASAQFTTPKRLRLNRGAVPTILNSSDEIYEAPEQGVSPTYNPFEKDSSATDNRENGSCDLYENDGDSVTREGVDEEHSSKGATEPVKEEEEDGGDNFDEDDDDDEEELDTPLRHVKVELENVSSPQGDENTDVPPPQNDNISPT